MTSELWQTFEIILLYILTGNDKFVLMRFSLGKPYARNMLQIGAFLNFTDLQEKVKI